MEDLLASDESSTVSPVNHTPSDRPHLGAYPAVAKIDNFLNDEHRRQVYGFLYRGCRLLQNEIAAQH
jgi:hypothetical protein